MMTKGDLLLLAMGNNSNKKQMTFIPTTPLCYWQPGHADILLIS